MSLLTEMAQTGDYVTLPHQDSYAVYFNDLSRAFKVLRNWSQSKNASGSMETRIIGQYLDRILTSTELLRLKHLFDPDHGVVLDLNESGLPHSMELNKLESDHRDVQDKLAQLPGFTMLQEEALRQMFANGEEPVRILELLGRRHYLQALSESSFLSGVQFGGVTLNQVAQNSRHYAATWICYGSQDNLPYIHVLLFEQDKRDKPLVEGTATWEAFRETIFTEGKRVPPLAVLAMSIDGNHETLHPKVLRRIRIGPFIFPRYSFDENALAGFLREKANPGEFSMELTTETVSSDHQIVKEKGGWFRPDKVREVFAISKTDLECFSRKLTNIEHFLFLPHRLYQLFSAENASMAETYSNHYKVTFNRQNEVYLQ